MSVFAIEVTSKKTRVYAQERGIIINQKQDLEKTLLNLNISKNIKRSKIITSSPSLEAIIKKIYPKLEIKTVNEALAATIGSDIPIDNTARIICHLADEETRIDLLVNKESKNSMVIKKTRAENEVSSAISSIIERTTPSQQLEIKTNKILIHGNNSVLENIHKLESLIKIPTLISPDPTCAIIKGIGRIMNYNQY
jgi:actin-like ATPase involved in cell morphogenesis